MISKQKVISEIFKAKSELKGQPAADRTSLIC